AGKCRSGQGGAGGRASPRPLARSPERFPRPVEARREGGRNPDATGPAGLQGVDRHDPGGRPEHAALIHPIAASRPQRDDGGLEGYSCTALDSTLISSISWPSSISVGFSVPLWPRPADKE